MKYDLEQNDDIAILTIHHEKLDTEISPDLKSKFVFVHNSDDSSDLVLDLSHVNFADSSGLSSLLLAHRLYRDSERTLIMCNLHERVQKLIDISQLGSVFNIAKSREEAISTILDSYE